MNMKGGQSLLPSGRSGKKLQHVKTLYLIHIMHDLLGVTSHKKYMKVLRSLGDMRMSVIAYKQQDCLLLTWLFEVSNSWPADVFVAAFIHSFANETNKR